MTEKEIMLQAISVFGEEMQENVAAEECAELIQAISHKHRGRAHNIAEEIADCEIMIEQLKMINGCAADVEEIRKKKIERLFERIFEECM